MLNVKNFLEMENPSEGKVANIEGILVLIEGDLFLIDVDYGKDYGKAPKLLILPKNLKYVLMSQLVLDGGGSSIFFHRAILGGNFFLVNKVFVLYPVHLSVLENSVPKKWVEVDVSQEAISKSVKRYSEVNNNDNFWDKK